ncbi:MAG: tetratricopeptide repeat protein, partial [Bacteroidota bacterium]
MNQRLLDAATAGDTATLLRALEAGASPEAADTSGATALMLATQSGRLNAVRTLVEAGADSQRKGVLWLNDEHTSYYGNVTSVAAGEGHTDVLAYLLDDLGIPVDDRERDPATGDDTGWTALQWAASAGQTEAVTVLVERGAVVDRAGDTLLLLAIRNGHATTAEMLLEVGAPVADASPDGMTALHWAAARLPATWVGMLLARGADVNATSSQGRTPLQVAALVGDVTFARLLVCEGATGAEAAQALAQERGHEAVVTVLGEVALEGSPDGAACAEGRAGALNQRVVALHGAGRYAEAVPLAREALAILEAALGPDHPDVALSLNNLAFLLRATGDYAGARPLLERALAIRETALGPGHPRVATSLNNLAGLLEATGDYVGARPLYERALAIRETALGPGHPRVATSLNNLAGLLEATGDYAGARPL